MPRKCAAVFLAVLVSGCASQRSVEPAQDVPRLLDEFRLSDSGHILTRIPKEFPKEEERRFECLSFILCSNPNYCIRNTCDRSRLATVHIIFARGPDREDSFYCLPNGTTARRIPNGAVSIQLVQDRP